MSRQGGQKVKILIDGQKVDQVNHFKYLGFVISEDGYYEKDVRCRIAMAKNAFMKKKRIVNSTIWSVALYTAKTWTLSETLRKK